MTLTIIAAIAVTYLAIGYILSVLNYEAGDPVIITLWPIFVTAFVCIHILWAAATLVDAVTRDDEE